MFYCMFYFTCDRSLRAACGLTIDQTTDDGDHSEQHSVLRVWHTSDVMIEGVVLVQ